MVLIYPHATASLATRLADTQRGIHRGFERQRVNRDRQRNLGSPYSPAGKVGIHRTSAKSIRRRRRGMDGGVSHSSVEVGNDHGAKGWQRMIALRGH